MADGGVDVPQKPQGRPHFGDPKRAEFDEAGWRAFEKQSSKKTCYSVYPDVWEAEKLVAKQGLPDDEPLAKYLREGISPYAE